MKTTKLSAERILKIAPWLLVAALSACSNPMPCPGEKGAPMDEMGNEVDPASSPNDKPHLNTACYYGRGNNGRITLLTQTPQTGFWNSSIYRIDQQSPMNTPPVPESTSITTTPLASVEQVSAPQQPVPQQPAALEPINPPSAVTQADASHHAAQIEPFVFSNNTTTTTAATAPTPAPAPLPALTAAPGPNQQLYYRAGKVNGKCGQMNVYRQAHMPPCPVEVASPLPPAPVPQQITYVNNNYPPVNVQTGVAPAQAAGAFLGGIGEDVIGAGALTYAIRYRPDRISNDSNSNNSVSATSTASAGATASSSALNGFHHPHDPSHGMGKGWGGEHGGGYHHAPTGGHEGYAKHGGGHNGYASNGDHYGNHGGKGSNTMKWDDGSMNKGSQKSADNSMLGTLEKW